MGRVHDSYQKAVMEAESQGIKYPNLVPRIVRSEKIKGTKFDASDWHIEWEILND